MGWKRALQLGGNCPADGTRSTGQSPLSWDSEWEPKASIAPIAAAVDLDSMPKAARRRLSQVVFRLSSDSGTLLKEDSVKLEEPHLAVVEPQLEGIR